MRTRSAPMFGSRRDCLSCFRSRLEPPCFLAERDGVFLYVFYVLRTLLKIMADETTDLG